MRSGGLVWGSGDFLPWRLCLFGWPGGHDLSGCSAIAEWWPFPRALCTGKCNDLLGHLRWSWVIIPSVRVKVEICKHPTATCHVIVYPTVSPLVRSPCLLLETESKNLEMKKCLTGHA